MDTQVLFSQSPHPIDPTLAAHLSSPTAQSARFSEKLKKYTFTKAGRRLECGGLKNALRARYYSHYKDNRSRRNTKKTQIKGSTAKLGKRVDAELADACAAKTKQLSKKWHPMTCELLKYWAERGHVLEACQVPVELVGVDAMRLTQSDVITTDRAGRVWLWEVKTGFPVGFSRVQETFSRNTPLRTIACTKLNIWHLQLEFTRAALVNGAGVRIDETRVIQIYAKKGCPLQVREHVPPPWIALLRNHAAPAPQRMLLLNKKKKRAREEEEEEETHKKIYVIDLTGAD
jgi:hypothetical protein